MPLTSPMRMSISTSPSNCMVVLFTRSYREPCCMFSITMRGSWVLLPATAPITVTMFGWRRYTITCISFMKSFWSLRYFSMVSSSVPEGLTPVSLKEARLKERRTLWRNDPLLNASGSWLSYALSLLLERASTLDVPLTIGSILAPATNTASEAFCVFWMAIMLAPRDPRERRLSPVSKSDPAESVMFALSNESCVVRTMPGPLRVTDSCFLNSSASLSSMVANLGRTRLTATSVPRNSARRTWPKVPRPSTTGGEPKSISSRRICQLVSSFFLRRRTTATAAATTTPTTATTAMITVVLLSPQSTHSQMPAALGSSLSSRHTFSFTSSRKGDSTTSVQFACPAAHVRIRSSCEPMSFAGRTNSNIPERLPAADCRCQVERSPHWYSTWSGATAPRAWRTSAQLSVTRTVTKSVCWRPSAHAAILVQGSVWFSEVGLST
mmetsp:Transcript_13790/g.29432  ORF Transcript_13790/g.29432 Transcript_13790/m.29432 type:complete len:439 (+) Transcript_13790:41-1357(+)